MFRFSTLAAAALFASATPASSAEPIVEAPAGTVQGTVDDGMNVFRGIPFAEPPVGPLRWQPPVAMARWQGVRPATEFGPACYQPVSKFQTVYSPPSPLPLSEDCLTLNVWSPAKANGPRDGGQPCRESVSCCSHGRLRES